MWNRGVTIPSPTSSPSSISFRSVKQTQTDIKTKQTVQKPPLWSFLWRCDNVWPWRHKHTDTLQVKSIAAKCYHNNHNYPSSISSTPPLLHHVPSPTITVNNEPTTVFLARQGCCSSWNAAVCMRGSPWYLFILAFIRHCGWASIDITSHSNPFESSADTETTTFTTLISFQGELTDSRRASVIHFFSCTKQRQCKLFLQTTTDSESAFENTSWQESEVTPQISTAALLQAMHEDNNFFVCLLGVCACVCSVLRYWKSQWSGKSVDRLVPPLYPLLCSYSCGNTANI